MEAGVVTKIAELAQVQEFKVVDNSTDIEHSYTTKPVHQVKPAPDAQPPLVKVYTLAGFTELVTQKIDGIDADKFVVHIENHSTVALMAKYADEHGRRLRLIEASPVAFEGFRFGQFMDHEDFVIHVSSKFSDTEDLAYVLGIASSVTDGATRQAEDDGLSQKVTLRRGLALRSDATIKPRVRLAPFRIFPECQQPVSDFLFRLKGGGDSAAPQLALFEADGGKWKVAAINEVRRYLSTLNIGCAIIA